MSSEFTTIIRYIPITAFQEQYRGIQLNTSFGVFTPTNIPVNTYTQPPRHISLTGLANMLLIVLLAILLVVVLISYTWLRRAPAPLRMAAIITATGEEKHSFLQYTYTGIKSALHDLYVKLRRTYCKPSCTPRELAERVPDLAKFAKVYEDVVYGDKYSEELKKDVEEVLNCCRSS